MSSLECQMSSLSWKIKILIVKKVWERVWKKCIIVALCIPLDSWAFRNWILFYYQMAVCCQKKKAFLFHFFPDSARHSFSSRSFHAETQKAFDLNAALSQGHVRGPVWRWSSAKTVISYLKSFQITVCFYELILLRYLL